MYEAPVPASDILVDGFIVPKVEHSLSKSRAMLCQKRGSECWKYVPDLSLVCGIAIS